MLPGGTAGLLLFLLLVRLCVVEDLPLEVLLQLLLQVLVLQDLLQERAQRLPRLRIRAPVNVINPSFNQTTQSFNQTTICRISPP